MGGSCRLGNVRLRDGRADDGERPAIADRIVNTIAEPTEAQDSALTASILVPEMTQTGARFRDSLLPGSRSGRARPVRCWRRCGIGRGGSLFRW